MARRRAGARPRPPRRAPRSSVKPSIVRARVTVVQSSRRTLIPMVRPRRPRRRRPPATSPASRRTTPSSTVASSTSESNVVSLDRDFTARASSTSELSWNCARRTRYGPVRPPKRALRTSGSARCRSATVRDAHRGQALRRLRADPRQAARSGGGEALARLLAAHRHEAGGLAQVAAALRDEAVGPDADRELHAGAALDLGDDPAQDAQRLLDAGEVGVALVDADLLDALEVVADGRPDLLRGRPVGLEVGRDEDGLRAQPPRARGRHRGADPVPAGLVGRRRDDRARPGARDDDGLAPQLGPAQQLDGRVEGVAVEVRDDALGGCRAGGHAMERTSPAGRDRGRAGRYRVTRIDPTPPKPRRSFVAAVRSYSRAPT